MRWIAKRMWRNGLYTIPVARTTFRIENSSGNPVTFEILYPQPHTIDEFQTDSSGTLYLPGTLPVGEYTLYEVCAPEPYLLNGEPVTFTVSEENSENGTVTIAMKDTPVKGRIAIEKKGEVLTGFTIEETEYGISISPSTKCKAWKAWFMRCLPPKISASPAGSTTRPGRKGRGTDDGQRRDGDIRPALFGKIHCKGKIHPEWLRP